MLFDLVALSLIFIRHFSDRSKDMVGVDSIGQSSVMSHFERMNAQMSSMAQRGQELSAQQLAQNNVLGNAEQAVNLSGQSDFFTGFQHLFTTFPVR